ncbi:unnamed protein product [Peniophora sp. CBMAI 1063]|nr:unnamed protein product [Peniophora sp. CBMAI 1063]
MPVHASATIRRPPTLAKRARGRPPNAGAAQTRIIIEDIGIYQALKTRNAPQSDITVAVNGTARKLIKLYGWDDPLRACTMKDTGAGVDAAVDEGEQKLRDVTLKRVRNEVKKIWRKNLERKESTGIRPSADIADLIKIFATKPRRKQDYKVWATLKPRPSLEAAVDIRHAARVRDTALTAVAPPRVSTWNAVASERFKEASPKEKKMARKIARRAHKKALQAWEAGASALPTSPEEAVQFMEASQMFLSDLMHFFASRTSGIAVMFLSGPAGSSLISEGVCDVPGQPKLLYTDVNPGGTKSFQYSLAKQAGILNGTHMRWGSVSEISITRADNEGAGALGDTAIGVGQEGDQDCEDDDESREDEDEDDLYADDQSEQHEESAAELRGIEFLSLLSSSNGERRQFGTPNASVADSTPIPVPGKAVPMLHKVGSRVCLGVAETAGEGESTTILPRVTEEIAAFAPFTYDVLHLYEADVVTNAVEYAPALRCLIAQISPHKPWLKESNTVNFLKALPIKLAGKVDMGLASELSLAYLRHESSKADELALTLRTVEHAHGSDPMEKPAYIADLRLRAFASRWNARADSDNSRTPAKLDADINISLPHQWALLQPAEHLDRQGCICVAPDIDMDWQDSLAPGLEGVRLLVVTALIWAYNIKDKEECKQWTRLAYDMLQVLRILVQQASCRNSESSTAAEDYIDGDGTGGLKRRKRYATRLLPLSIPNKHR